ncbi:F-box domain-containing protein [Favolaschia claudopus]|uniref:F-box domain-containing protein n=1 Tax=Favolaschia claudopus TaxID=2862362 RepID=A0AAW0CZL9_9AGAR
MSNLSLLSMPNEILLVIFSHLRDPYPLYPLSTLCRRLHHIALPLYLSRTGVYTEPSGSKSETYHASSISIAGDKTYTLAALQIALFLRDVPLRTLSCTFADSQSQVIDFARFRRLCSMLGRIETAHLQLQVQNHGYFGGQPTYDDVVHVLNAVLEKSCVGLTVDVAHDPTLGPARLSRRGRGGDPTRKTHEFQTLAVPALSSSAFRLKTLKTFRMHSEILFSPHCRAWTIDVLNSFPIVSLSIDVPSVPTDALDALLLVTEIPTLRDLALLRCRVKPSALHLFLSRHPGITRLHLGHIFVPSLQERLPPDHLPQLRDLTAPAPQISYLLQAMEQTTSLRAVRVLSHMTRLDLSFIDASLQPVVSRLESVYITLVLPVPPQLPRFGTDLELLSSDDCLLALVRTLEFVFAPENVTFTKLSDYLCLTAWCELFPDLKSVELSGFDSTYSTQLALEALHKRVQKVVLNGVEHTDTPLVPAL